MHHNANRRNIPEIKQQEQKGSYQQVRSPFQEKYTDDEGNIIEYLDDSQINLMGINNDETIFLTQEEQELFLLTQIELDSEESEEYKQGFDNSIM